MVLSLAPLMERQLFILREDHQHRTRPEFINSLTRSPANLNFSGGFAPIGGQNGIMKVSFKGADGVITP